MDHMGSFLAVSVILLHTAVAYVNHLLLEVTDPSNDTFSITLEWDGYLYLFPGVIPIEANFDNNRLRLYPDTTPGASRCSSSSSLWRELYIENVNRGTDTLDIDSIVVDWGLTGDYKYWDNFKQGSRNGTDVCLGTSCYMGTYPYLNIILYGSGDPSVRSSGSAPKSCPTPIPTAAPTVTTSIPSNSPTMEPTLMTSEPSGSPTIEPTTAEPTHPTSNPITSKPTETPTPAPTLPYTVTWTPFNGTVSTQCSNGETAIYCGYRDSPDNAARDYWYVYQSDINECTGYDLNGGELQTVCIPSEYINDIKIIEAKYITGSAFCHAKCPQNYKVINCGFRRCANVSSCDYEIFPRVFPKYYDNDIIGCEAYDYFGPSNDGSCFATCIDNIDETYHIEKSRNNKSLSCNGNGNLFGCGINDLGIDEEVFVGEYMNDDGSGCNVYQYFGAKFMQCVVH